MNIECHGRTDFRVTVKVGERHISGLLGSWAKELISGFSGSARHPNIYNLYNIYRKSVRYNLHL